MTSNTLGLDDALHLKQSGHGAKDFDRLASEVPPSLLRLEAERLDLDSEHLDEEQLRVAIGCWMRKQRSDAAGEDIADDS